VTDTIEEMTVEVEEDTKDVVEAEIDDLIEIVEEEAIGGVAIETKNNRK
jgi:hypothetical protein